MDFELRIAMWDQLSRWERSELGKDLRRSGLSYGEIMDLIPVKKSTLATWCRDVTLTEEQWQAIKERTGSQAGIPRDTNRKRRLEIEAIRELARLQVPVLVRDPKWVAGIVLYWAEGAKTQNKLRLVNSDPNALRLFIWWVRRFLDEEATFSVHLHLHEGNDESAARSFWRRETGLTDATFHRTYIKPAGTGHRKNHLVHGVCTVNVRRCSDAWNTTMAWIDGLAAELGVAQPGK
jgi:hypothetical protein